MKKILLIEDNNEMRENISEILSLANYAVLTAENGKTGVEIAKKDKPDLIICDIMMPDLDGYGVLHILSKDPETIAIPFIFLTAKAEKSDLRKGMSLGADDYLTKPYHMAELLARIDALARRGDSGNAEASTKLKLADLELDRMTRRVMRNGKKIELTAREFQLLEFMMRHSGQVVTRTMLLEGVWDYHFDPQTNVIDVHISRLRQAIDKDFDKPLLHTVRGAGYSLREDE